MMVLLHFAEEDPLFSPLWWFAAPVVELLRPLGLVCRSIEQQERVCVSTSLLRSIGETRKRVSGGVVVVE